MNNTFLLFPSKRRNTCAKKDMNALGKLKKMQELSYLIMQAVCPAFMLHSDSSESNQLNLQEIQIFALAG